MNDLGVNERWRIIHGDCREVLPRLGQVDHVITDPPYNAATHANARSLKGGGSDIAIDFDSIDPAEVAPLLLRNASRWVVAFCAMEQLGLYALAAGARWVRSGVWDRPDGTPQISGDRPGQAAEGVAIMHGSIKKRWNSGGKRGMWRCGVERIDRHHPTPKPLPLMLEIIADFTDPGDLVLDPFCGSGTTGLACLRLGRRFLGVERDEKYYAVAVERLKAEERGLTLRDARAGQRSIFDALGGEP